jgi:hypothetical protein
MIFKNRALSLQMIDQKNNKEKLGWSKV